MSGLSKGIGKVFRSVGKFVKKIAPIALAVGAMMFTGGASLGLPGLGAGFGRAAAAGAGAAGGGFFNTVIGQAAKQALVGGTLSKISGGDFASGAKVGALTGLAGGLFPATGATKGLGAALGTAAPSGLAQAGAGGGLRGLLGSILSDKEMMGGIIKGAAQGWMQKAQDLEAREAERRLQNTYGGSGEAMKFSAEEQTPFEPKAQKTRFEEAPQKRFQYNPETKRIEFA